MKGIKILKKKTKGRIQNVRQRKRDLSTGENLAGLDLPLSGYLIKAKDEKSGSVTLYRSYNDFVNGENEIFSETFLGDYFISLVEKKQYICVNNADITKLETSYIVND